MLTGLAVGASSLDTSAVVPDWPVPVVILVTGPATVQTTWSVEPPSASLDGR